MNIAIQARDFDMTQALAAHVRRRLGFALTRHGDRVQRVSVRLGDDNGPRGGVDKFCRIQVHLRDAPMAVVEDIGANLYAAIDRAADRVGRVVVKHIDRAHEGRRGPRRAATGVPAASVGRTSSPAGLAHRRWTSFDTETWA